MTIPALVTVAFRNADTGRANERAISVKDKPWNSDSEIASDAIWIVQSWRNVDRDSVSVVNIERAKDRTAKYEAQRAAQAGVAI